MDFLINSEELEVLYGLPHIQQLAYFRGIRPYMDVKTGLVGIKRGISYQSIAEQLYIEPHPGIKSISFSRAQMIRAVAGLERAGLVSMQSGDLQLVLKCEKATLHYSVQNKAVINPSQQAVIFPTAERPLNTGDSEGLIKKADIPNPSKAVTPLINNNYLYIYLSEQFAKFWESYPEQKSRQKAFAVFQEINPSETLFSQMMAALEQQKIAHATLKAQGSWIAPWKYPANWLLQRSWEDAITEIHTQESKQNAYVKNTRKKEVRDLFTPDWDEYADDTEEACAFEGADEREQDNIVQFNQHR